MLKKYAINYEIIAISMWEINFHSKDWEPENFVLLGENTAGKSLR